MNEQLIADLKATRDQLKARGRCTGVPIQRDGKVCLDGAIGMATVANFDQLNIGEQYPALDGSHRARAVMDALQRHLPGLFGNRALYPDSLTAVFFYNDARGTTDEDCFNLIDKALAAEGGLA